MALAVEAALVAGGSGTVVALPFPAQAKPADASVPVFGPAQAQDLASARLMARLQGRQIEVLGERTDASQTFVNADGTVTYTAFAEPKWVKHGSAWADVDATLTLRADGTIRPAAPESSLALSGGGNSPVVSMTVDGKNVSLAWPSALPTPSLSGATATYSNVLDGVDLQVTATPAGGAEETLVVKTAEAASDPGLADLVQTVSTSNGITASTDAGGNLTVQDTDGRVLVNSPAAVMWDSATAPGTTAAATPTTLSSDRNAAASAPARSAKTSRSTAQGPGTGAHRALVKTSLKNHKLHLVADKGLLSAKTTVFPVFIDPAYVPHPASGSTLHFDQVQQAFPSVSNYDVAPADGNGVGFQGFSSPTGIERTYYRVGIPSAIWDGHVLSASMKLTESYSASCGTTAYGVQAWSTGVFDASTTWSNAPAKVGLQDTVNFGPACTSTPSGNLSFMDQVTNAAANHWQTIAFVVVDSNETDDVQFKRFSKTASLSITYNSPPTTPTSLTASPSATAGYAASGTPTLSAKATDANSDTVRLDYQILSGTTVKASGSSAFVTSGTAATWKPATALADGAYTWKVRAYDGEDFSAWTAAQTLTIDTNAPSATSVSSAAFPAGVWSGTPDASGNFSGSFTFTPPTSDAVSVVWALDGGSAHTHTTTGSAVSDTVSFRAGKHTLTAQTHDAAGNVSSTASYVFYAGSGAALLTPRQGDQPARRVSLTGQGKSTDTGVTYQYRRGETDTWHTVLLADVSVTSSGAAVSAWPIAAPSGVPTALTWNITNTFTEDGPIDVRAVFTDGTTSDDSPANTITVDRDAGTAPSAQVAEGVVNELTGDLTLTGLDASAFGMSVSRVASSRKPTAGADAEGQVAVFGPQWQSGTVATIQQSDWGYVRKTSATSVAVIDANGSETGFNATSSGGWQEQPGVRRLTLTGSLTGSFVLKDDQGTSTTFVKVDPAATTWQVSTTYLPTSDSTTTVVSEKVVSGTLTLARPKYVIAPTAAVAAATCETAPSTKGCRMLEFDYAGTTTATSSAFGDYAGRVKQITLWATAPGDAAATSSPIAQYDYDSAGQLREVWDPRISPALKTAYAYDASGRVTMLNTPGQLPWTFTYGRAGNAATAGDGMLLSASRPTLAAGSKTTTDGGTAVTSLVYDVPLTGANSPYAMGSADVSAWGQTDAPTDGTAVFPADSVPASHAGSGLSSGDYRRATLSYADASGREVNAVEPGGHVTTTEYDQFGNSVRELTPGNRELALATGGPSLDLLTSLGLDASGTAERAAQLSTTRVYSADGQNELAEFGPLHKVTLAKALLADVGGTDLPAGTEIPARLHTVTAYDQGRPTDGSASASGLPTTVTTGASVSGYSRDADTHTTTTAYDWAKALPVSTTDDPGGLNVTKTTAYDAQGRPTKVMQPKSTGTDAGATLTTYYAATGTGACNGRPEWAGLVCSTAPAGAITGGASNPDQRPTTTTEYDRWGNAAKVTETANGVTRTTINTYDTAGRKSATSLTGGVGTAVPDSTTAYDPASGTVAAVTSNGQTVTHVTDALGREISYSDGAGNTTTTTYDALDRPVTVTDSAPSTTTFSYDTTAEPRGLPTSLTDSVAGAVTAAYGPDGELATERLPGGYTLAVGTDNVGQETSAVYTRDSDASEVLADTADYAVNGDIVDHTETTGDTTTQNYSYDQTGRLTGSDSLSDDGSCSRHVYGYDGDSNRTSLTTSFGDPGTGCTDTGATTATSAYDSADRLIAPGVAYDAFGRTTTEAAGASNSYYANDLVRSQTLGTLRQTWNLDAAGRLASWTTESQGSDGTWSQTGQKTNHYASDGDDPSWIQEDAAGGLTRNVHDLAGNLAATTTATGSVTLQLADIHGDVAVQLALDSGTATVSSYDEFGAATTASRYGWQGSDQRSSETPSGATLMGVRLYDPTIGRFLQPDPVPGGAATAYDYADQNPVTVEDSDGTSASSSCHHNKFFRWCRVNVSEYTTRMIIDGLNWGWGAGGAFTVAGVAKAVGKALTKMAAYITIICGIGAGTLAWIDDAGHNRGVYFEGVYNAKFGWSWRHGFHRTGWSFLYGYVWHR